MLRMRAKLRARMLLLMKLRSHNDMRSLEPLLDTSPRA